MSFRPSLTDEQRIAWLRLARSERVGVRTFHNFINRFGSAQAALDALPDIITRAGGAAIPTIFTENDAEQELNEAARHGIRHVAFGEPSYPSLLRNIDDAPPFLLIQGTVDFESHPQVAIVGSRNASITGQKMANQIARDLSEAGYLTISGLARGIDTAAHKASLDKGTVAVIAGGHLKLYPAENKDLARKIIDHGGAIISESPPAFVPRGKDFPRRNRIISGMSLGVVIIEAARRSGSLITARLANEQGRQVFAVPGSPLDPRAEGTNDLIRNGATLIRSAEDILEDLRPTISNNSASDQPDQSPFRLEARSDDDFTVDHIPEDAHGLIINGLSASPVHIDDIIRFTDLPAAVVISTLCELEVSNRIIRQEGNTFALA